MERPWPLAEDWAPEELSLLLGDLGAVVPCKSPQKAKSMESSSEVRARQEIFPGGELLGTKALLFFPRTFFQNNFLLAYIYYCQKLIHNPL